MRYFILRRVQQNLYKQGPSRNSYYKKEWLYINKKIIIYSKLQMPLKQTYLYEQITPYYWLHFKYLNQSEGKNLNTAYI